MSAKATAAILELHTILDSMATVSGRQSIKLRISIIKINERRKSGNVPKGWAI